MNNEKSCICVIAHRPNLNWLNFLQQQKKYKTFLVIDDNNIDYCYQYKSYFPDVEIIQIDDSQCIQYGFSDLNYLMKKKVTGWEKAIYYFSCINRNYDYVWLIEDDVFFYSDNVLKNIDIMFPSQDLLSADCSLRRDTPLWWHWNRIEIDHPLPHYKSMVCAIRISRLLLKKIETYAKEKKHLFFLETFFPTIAKHNHLQCASPKELSSIVYRQDWKLKDMNKTHLFHPIKDINLHTQYREQLSKNEIYNKVINREDIKALLMNKNVHIPTKSSLFPHVCGAIFFENKNSDLDFSDVMDIHVISLRDSKRLYDFFTKYTLDYPIRLFEAIDACRKDFDFSIYPETNNVAPVKGQEGHLGCTLSHFYLWKKLSNSSKKYHLILEDDTFFSAYADDAIKHLLENIPNDADLIFVNGRSSEKLYSQCRYINGYWQVIPDKFIYSKEEMLSIMNENYEHLKENPKNGKKIFYSGTDGYLVTQKGLSKLNDYVEKHGLGNKPSGAGNNIDLILTAITTSISDHKARPLVSNLKKKIKLGQICDKALINAYVLNYPIVDTCNRAGIGAGIDTNKVNYVIKEKDINLIRDASLALEQTDRDQSYKLMLLAHNLRPSGEFINNQLSRIESLKNEDRINISTLQYRFGEGLNLLHLNYFDKAEQVFMELIQKHKFLLAYVELLRLTKMCYPEDNKSLSRQLDIMEKLHRDHKVDITQRKEELLSALKQIKRPANKQLNTPFSLERNYPSKLPDFLIIGAAKCGTTSLWSHLKQHPNIEMSPNFIKVNGKNKLSGKEVRFFASRLWSEKGIEWYTSCFNDNGKLQGEATPAYLVKPIAHRRMHKCVPNAKLIILLRDPVKRALSAYNHAVRVNKGFWDVDVTASFEENIKRSLANKPLLFIETGKYIEHIEQLLTYYSREQILILISEEMRATPQQVYKQVFDFLGINSLDLEHNASINQHSYKQPLSDESVELLVNFYAPYNKRLFDFLGRKIDTWM
jgi:GR25 family glycosyltransferase involved in LPS biosynthesis